MDDNPSPSSEYFCESWSLLTWIILDPQGQWFSSHPQFFLLRLLCPTSRKLCNNFKPQPSTDITKFSSQLSQIIYPSWTSSLPFLFCSPGVPYKLPLIPITSSLSTHMPPSPRWVQFLSARRPFSDIRLAYLHPQYPRYISRSHQLRKFSRHLGRNSDRRWPNPLPKCCWEPGWWPTFMGYETCLLLQVCSQLNRPFSTKTDSLAHTLSWTPQSKVNRPSQVH